MLRLRVEGKNGPLSWGNLVSINQGAGVGVGIWVDDNFVCCR